jgi:hypothetical protein
VVLVKALAGLLPEGVTRWLKEQVFPGGRTYRILFSVLGSSTALVTNLLMSFSFTKITRVFFFSNKRVASVSLFINVLHVRVYSTWALDIQQIIQVPNSRRHNRNNCVIILICWRLWLERNARIFHSQEKTLSALLSEIKDEARLWAWAGAEGIKSIVGRVASE